MLIDAEMGMAPPRAAADSGERFETRLARALDASGHKGEALAFTPECSAELLAAAAQLGVDWRVLALAAHCKVVSALTGQTQITTAVRVNDSGWLCLSCDLRDPRQTWDGLVRELSRSLRHAPPSAPALDSALFDTAVDFGNGENLEDWPGHALSIRFSLTFGARLYAVVRSCSDLSAGRYGDGLAGYYTRSLTRVVRAGASPHAAETLVSREEQRALHASLSCSRAFFSDRPLLALFCEQAAHTPDRPAVIAAAGTLSYAELDSRSNQLARHLIACGVQPKVLVGVCLQRNPRMLIALLAIMKAGAAYVPLDPSYPAERLKFMLQDAGVRLVLVEHATAGSLPDGAAQLPIDLHAAQIDTLSPEPLAFAPHPEDLAYLVYTSGSTGTPKAAAIEHRSVVDLMHWAREEFGLGALQGVLATSSICFDMSIFELYAPLSWGGCVILLDNILGLIDAPARERITLISTVPSALCELASLGWVPEQTPFALLAGEPLTRAVVDRIFEHSQLSQIWNAYGLSEDTTYTTVSAIEHGSIGPVTIGRPIANRQLSVRDEHGQLTPAGAPGELYVSGRGLARGYHNRPELTAQRFLQLDRRAYRTGDLVRVREDGELQYLGRRDGQLKLRGHRIELGEIESVLASHPAVAQCAVSCRGEAADASLRAYVLLRASASAQPLQLKDHVRTRLPAWMVPSEFVRVERLPLTAHGKLDRRSLAATRACAWPEDVLSVRGKVG